MFLSLLHSIGIQLIPVMNFGCVHTSGVKLPELYFATFISEWWVIACKYKRMMPSRAPPPTKISITFLVHTCACVFCFSWEFSYVCYWKGFWGMSSNCFWKEKLPNCSAMLVTNFSINWIYVESCFYFPQMPWKMTEFVLNYMFKNITLFLKRTNSFLLLLVVVTKSRVVYFSPCSFTFKLLRCHTTSGIRNLWLASQMWLFWRRHLARLMFS